jgi:HlyD family secretion protein
VQVGKKNGLAAEVVDGLALHDTIIVHPSDKVGDGVEVVRR